jgi:hypothetical protein
MDSTGGSELNLTALAKYASEMILVFHLVIEKLSKSPPNSSKYT